MFTTLLTKTLLMLLITGSMAGLIVGVWMLFRPQSFLRVNQFLSQWHSTRKATKPLMVSRRTEHFVYRHHRPVGLLILAGSTYVLYALVYYYDRKKLGAAIFGDAYFAPLAEWLVPGLTLALGVGVLFAMGIGGFLLIRPSLLKGFEAWANRWVSLRRAGRVWDEMHEGPDRFLIRWRPWVAVALILGSSYALIRLSVFIR
ncbi:MAG: hypothetical protein HY942_03495 [Gammaproteobacteria bacterium]|nr:hypothetical protein [Gammaproteobacteria bacterium]